MNDRYSEEIWICWTYFELFRRLGFPSADIFVMNYMSPMRIVVVGVIVQSQGKEFVVDVAPLRGSWNEFAKSWEKFSGELNAGLLKDSELSEVFYPSVAHRMMPEIAATMMAKGFKMPRGSVP